MRWEGLQLMKQASKQASKQTSKDRFNWMCRDPTWSKTCMLTWTTIVPYKAWYMTHFLLRGGASPNIKGPSCSTPLLEIIYLRDTKTAMTFIRTVNQYGADVNYFNHKGIWPLFDSGCNWQTNLVTGPTEKSKSKHRHVSTHVLELFFECGVALKRKWFRNSLPVWGDAKMLSQKVPSLM